MKKKALNVVLKLSLILYVSLMLSCSFSEDDAFSERTKIALREVGNQLLLTDQDSTSLVLPVMTLDNSKYELSFEKQLAFEPNTLVTITQNSLSKAKLPENYRVEVIQCKDNEVAYSYEMSADKESTIIPCAGRILPNACYTIQVKFTRELATALSKKSLFYIYVISVIGLLIVYFYKKKRASKIYNGGETFFIGSFQFYPEQNKLVKQAIEISLSKKECELLEIFVANPNQIVKRDELTKKVWEDNGVIVGRSLDTYISKLRKKLKDDTSIKLTNVHGVGYKLEV